MKGKEKLKEQLEDNIQELRKLAEDPEAREALETAVKVFKPEINKIAQAGFFGNAMSNLKGAFSSLGKVDPETAKNMLAAGGGLAGLATGGATLANEIAQRSQPTEKHLNKILETNPEIRNQYDREEIERTFNSLKVHAPRLIKQDPHGAGQAMKKFLDVQGFDIRSLDKLLEIEDKKQKQERKLFKTSSKKDYDEYMADLAKAASDFEHERTQEEVQAEYNKLKEILDV
jgi:hypothetical protein